MVIGTLFAGLNRKGRDADQRLGLGTAIVLLHCYAIMLCYRDKYTFPVQATIVLRTEAGSICGTKGTCSAVGPAIKG